MKINKNKVIVTTVAVVAATTIALQANTIADNNANIEKLTKDKENISNTLEKTNETLSEKLKMIDEMKEIEENLKKKVEELEKELASIVDLELTYYTTLPEENGGYTTTAIQTELRHGVIASNYYPIGTKILIEGTVYTVEDRGSSNFDSPNRLDVLVERQQGELNEQYKKRVKAMGRKKVKGRILN